MPAISVTHLSGIILGLGALASTVFAQSAPPVDSLRTSRVQSEIGVMGTGVLTRAAPAYNHRSYMELQLVQPVITASLFLRGLSFLGALNAEGLTLNRGELNAGIWGEGYVDRRHPHTLIHEAMLAFESPLLRRGSGTTPVSLSFSVAAGRGFVPFGSDDPMMRPFEKYPVNHHHSQILERIQTIAAARVARGDQAFVLEAATFNGDEPAGPFHGPRWSRLGDSWSMRATGQLLRGIELSASEAAVVSPELQQGGAFDHRQHHASFRFERANNRGDVRYVLAELAQTDEIANGTTAFTYRSMLVEGAYDWRGASVALRAERTDRGEQTRLIDPFRTPLGHVDFQILGVTQWDGFTVALTGPSPAPIRRALRTSVMPFVEIARATPTPRNRPTVFEPAAFYGASTLWSLSAGFRVHAGSMRSRMGRYGVLSGRSGATGMTHNMHHDE